MSPHPLRLILTSYAIAGAIALVLPGLSLLGQVLTIWLGGAALMFTLAMTPGVNRYFRNTATEVSDDHQSESDLEREYQRWDEDAVLEHLNAEADMGVGAAGLEAEPKRASGGG